uniref:Integrase catalytic domain-containing protein n=1 Tax=Trichogramma kaykai TaxID=54128 RepID=A0ABD2XAC8_9HYME
MSEESIGGGRFFVTCIDDATNYCFIYFMKHKANMFEKFKEYERAVANKFGRPIKTLNSDNGREYYFSTVYAPAKCQV